LRPFIVWWHWSRQRSAATHAGVFAAPDPAWQEYGGGRKLFIEASARIVPKTR
jgi:hypothetical protein